jgi:hypothetical protein
LAGTGTQIGLQTSKRSMRLQDGRDVIRASKFRAPRDDGEIERSTPSPIRLAFGHKGLHSLAKILTAVGIKHQVLATG